MQGSSSQYVFPAKRYAFHLFFLPLWLTGWAFGELSTIREIVHDGRHDLFIFFWIALWTFGGAGAAYSWLWQLAGQEIVTVSNTSLTIRRAIFGIGVERAYELQHVRNLRLMPVDDSPRRRKLNDDGRIAFDYVARTYRFAAGLDRAGAMAVITELKTHYPLAGV